ncbi:PREDICTED: uncharacterized protein LOC108554752, partial [Eufriesea mexicana]|uniref:uncharacterized protein LOC108554752 n=1 Tax=Eufriesea mexicana TaxID=516756 RepID=UPI00083BDC65
YDSWNYRNVDPKGELEKAKKAERLQARRNKLRNLLKEEDESYKRELEERKRVKSRAEESSLEVLKQKLREQRAEQSLYLPRSCRRYQSYFVYPKDLSSPSWSTLRGTNLQHSRACRDSTNFIHQTRQTSHRGNSKMSAESGTSLQEQENATQLEVLRHPSSSSATGRPSSRYSARYARRSLENTNVRCDDTVDYPSSRVASKSSLVLGSS